MIQNPFKYLHFGRNNVWLTLLISLFFIPCYAVKKESDVERHLNGQPVKSKKYFSAIYIKGEAKKDYLISVSNYNQNGNCVEYVSFEKNGSVSKRDTYSYDDRGNKLEEIKYKGENTLKSRAVFKYDENDNKIECCFYDGKNCLNEKSISKYDREGHLIESYYVDKDGKLLSNKLVCVYDDHGNMLEEYSYLDGILDHKRSYRYRYDNIGKIIGTTTLMNDEIQEDCNSILKDDGRITETKCVSSQGTYSITKYEKGVGRVEMVLFDENGDMHFGKYEKYSEEGHLIEESETFRGQLESKTTYTYDKSGRLLEYDEFHCFSNRVEKHQYEYTHGENNLSHQCCYYNDKNELLERTVYVYDDNGKLLEYSFYNREGQLENRKISKYNSHGNLVEYFRFEGVEQKQVEGNIYEFEYYE